jgi:hypothetical protein
MTLRERKKNGEAIVAKYQALLRNDKYASAVDAIADILLAVAQTDGEGTQILHAAEVEFRNSAEMENFVSEG